MANLLNDDFYRRYGNDGDQVMLDLDGIEDFLEEDPLFTLAIHMERRQDSILTGSLSGEEAC